MGREISDISVTHHVPSAIPLPLEEKAPSGAGIISPQHNFHEQYPSQNGPTLSLNTLEPKALCPDLFS